MNRYLARLGSLDEKRAYLSHPQNLQNSSKRGFEGFEGSGDEPYTSALAALRTTCPAYVPDDRWRQTIADATSFVAEWGGQAEAFGWTARELFGLHTPPKRPLASYRRLARYDETGLIWLLRGRPVIALTETVATIQGATAVLTYRKLNKPALGPLGDSLDD
jgi:hypothetical protein